MKGKLFRRILSAALSVVMVLSVFAVGGISAYAAEDDPTVKMAIKGVTRKYPLANGLLEAINNSRGSTMQLVGDSDLFNQAMERAAQLSLYPNTADLLGEDYNQGTSGTEAVAVINNGADMTADELLNALFNLPDSQKLVDFKQTVMDSNARQIGIGVVTVESRAAHSNNNKAFVCIRTAYNKGTVINYNTADHPDDETINQAICMTRKSFEANKLETYLYDVDSGNYLLTQFAEMQKGRQYMLVMELKSYDNLVGQTYAIVLPKLDGTGASYTSGSAFSYLYAEPVEYNSLTPASNTPSVRMFLDTPINAPTGSTKYFSDYYALTALGEYGGSDDIPDYYFDESSITLESDEWYYTGAYIRPAVTVKNKKTGEVLEEGTHYRLIYKNNLGNSSTDVTATVTVKPVSSSDYYLTTDPVILSFTIYAVQPAFAITGMRLVAPDVTYPDFYAGDRLQVTPQSNRADVTYESLIATAKDGHTITATFNNSTTDPRFTLMPDAAGEWTLTLTGSKDGETSVKTETVTLLGAMTGELTSSESETTVNSEITLTASVTGGKGTLTYEFTDENGSILETKEDPNVAVAVTTATGKWEYKCTVTDENGRSKIYRTYVQVNKGEVVPTVLGQNLRLQGDIGINIFMELPSSDYTIKMNGPAGEKEYAAADHYIQTSGEYGSAYMSKYVFGYNVAASEMGESVTIAVYKDGVKQSLYRYNGQAIVEADNDEYSTTVHNYFAAAKTSSDYASIQDLAESMYTYGSYAEKFFTGEDISDRELNDISGVTEGTLEQFAVDKQGTAPEGVTVRGYTLVLEDSTSMRVYLKVQSDADVKLFVNGTAAELKKGSLGTYIEMRNVSAQYLNQSFPFTISNSAGDEASTLRIYCCPLTYAYLVVKAYDGKGTNQDLCDLMKAMYLYNAAAKAYFKTN